MKKILLLLSLMFILSINTISQTKINAWGGYSWINGVVGIEAQYGHFGIGAGYFPTKMPNSNENIPSFGGSVTFYTKSNESLKKSLDIGYYCSIGVASAGYRYQSLSEDVIIPMTYGIIGVKGYRNKLYFKTGGGYGWCKDYSSFTFELGIGYTLFTNP